MRRPLLPPSHVTRALFGLAGTALAGALVIDHFRAEPAPAPAQLRSPMTISDCDRS